jgi:ribosomal protein S26
LSARVASAPLIQEENLARKTVLVCDNCGNEIEESKGAVMRINFNDARRGSKQADLCDACAAKMPGQAAARRGRRPKAASAG